MGNLFRPLKRTMPSSLFWRAFLILVIPIVALQAVVAMVFIQRHYDGVTEQMASSVAREISYAIRAVEQAPDVAGARDLLDQMGPAFGFELGLDEGARIEPSAVRALYDLTGSVIAETLREELGRPMALDFLRVRKRVDLRVGTTKGVLRVLIPRGRMNASNPHLLLVWMSATALVLTAVASVFLRNQVRPIGELAKAAAAFGRGRAEAFRPSGAEEVRRAGHAFLDMRGRIERQIGQRTLLLSGVSHDLRTPLTRMKLALAVSEPGPETVELERDVTEMERMLEAFLDFARGEGGEEAVPVDPVDLVAELVEDARRRGITVSSFVRIEASGPHETALRRAAIKRCIGNLIENGARYGKAVTLSTRLNRRSLEFVVEDDGPGIPPEQREKALRPFHRLDQSRNQDSGSGVGLGLSIALDIARSHGGALTLDESPRLGGLRVTVLLPR
jgi:two-component system osmolarity sensor histidine kinase EnvZ